MQCNINGIQQIGIGVTNLWTSWKWYKKAFGFDVKIFDDNDVAQLMLPYTGGQPQNRHAALAMNMAGGGGLEIWQYTQRKPTLPEFEIQLGDVGIFAAKIKCRNAQRARIHLTSLDTLMLTEVTLNAAGQNHFFATDPFGNTFNLVEDSTQWFGKPKKNIGGTYGAIIGVKSIEAAMTVYGSILGYDNVLFDGTSIFPDYSQLLQGQRVFRRVILTHSKARQGAFSSLLGNSQIELVQAIDSEVKAIYQNRYWGDPGFIHLCFDISNMSNLETHSTKLGYPFVVSSKGSHNPQQSFDMGDAAGHFSYIEDSDGTLIEFVETHKVPIIKKLGIFINLKNKNTNGPLPNWLVNLMGLSKVKFPK